MKSGFVTIIGRTNVGKSTLLNQILQKKVSITTYKPQTTRNAIQGIYNDEDSQIIFIDTPGVLTPHHKLDTFMNKEALTSLADVEAVIYLIDSSLKFSLNEEEKMLKRLETITVPFFLVFNKIDLCNIEHMQEIKNNYLSLYKNAKVIEISALDGFNVDTLIKEIKNILNEGELYYDKKTISNHNLNFLFQELIREQLLLLLKKEVPHSCAVKVNEIQKKTNSYQVFAKIIVEKASQKGIVIGKNGSTIKKIGINSRLEMEKIVHKKINLDLLVSVEEDWRNSQRILKEYGYNN